MMALLATRLAAAATLLAALVLLELTLPDVLPGLISLALVVVLVIQWAAVAFFVPRSVADPSILSLQTRAQDAISLALASTSTAAVVVFRAVTPANEPVSIAVLLIGLSFTLVMVAAPAVNWFVTYRPWQS